MWSSNVNLKCTLLNAENLFLLFDTTPSQEDLKLSELEWQKRSTSVFENKSIRKCRELAMALLELDSDVVMLCEVGGLESLENFNRLFLNNQYACALTEGNSDRQIDVGFLIRKGSPFYFDLLSNRTRPINYLYPHERESVAHGYPLKIQSHRFSRDVVELRLFQKDREKPFLIFLLTHLKSRLDKDRIDPGGFERRQAEFKTLLEIYRELQARYPEVPTLVCGDLNGNASPNSTDEEFRPLYESGLDLRDVLEVAQIAPLDRWTYYQVRSGARGEGRQIDYAFLNSAAQQKLHSSSVKIYRYKDHLGQEMDPPQNLEAKLNLPSDHYPISFELKDIKAF